jgi:hypothetical protein
MSMPDYPPDPNPPAVTPPSPGTPASDYTIPSQFTPPANRTDPLVLPPNSSYGAWFSTVMEVAKRSWKSALIISAIGIAAPLAIVSLISYTMDVGGMLSMFGFFTHRGFSFIGFLGALFVKLLLLIAAAFVTSAGWAAGSWALVQEAKTGRSANVNAAFQYGLKRAMRLFPWAVLAGIAFFIGYWFLWVPALAVAFGFSMFGFAATFENTANPLVRSFTMLLRNIGPSLGRVGTVLGIYLVYYWIVSAFFALLTLPGQIFGGGSFGAHLLSGIIWMIGTVVLAPAFAFLLIGLFVTYAELRAQEGPTSTDALAAELG